MHTKWVQGSKRPLRANYRTHVCMYLYFIGFLCCVPPNYLYRCVTFVFNLLFVFIFLCAFRWKISAHDWDESRIENQSESRKHAKKANTQFINNKLVVGTLGFTVAKSNYVRFQRKKERKISVSQSHFILFCFSTTQSTFNLKRL